ncbi:hypothetical protein O181_111330 [Austropuccinia psidii MF-1]|uniref:Uncharacterized protein n=1 Tax=Austropuccinia psidii MF-1 TaxID=1389203 RepID=A0A9Q3K268_9BASI|nr:hypothetical protein [Austropuccinia psidii MF-1]
MSSLNCHYGSGYSDSVKVFSDKELEELLFGYPSSPSESRGFWDWATKPHSIPASPPALAALSRVPSPLTSSKNIPEAALAFYSLIEGKYDPCLFVPDPLSYFLGEEALNASPKKNKNGFRNVRFVYETLDNSNNIKSTMTVLSRKI